MRNYLYQKLAAQKDSFARAIKHEVEERLSSTSSHQLNAKRGTITGEGLVRGSYIYGNVQIGKDAVLANCIVDQNVTLIIEDGAKVTDSGFHPYVTPSDSMLHPTEIRIGKNSVVARVYISLPTTIGADCTIAWCGINMNRHDYNINVGPEGIEIGDNAVIYWAYLDTCKSPEQPRQTRVCKCTIGKNLFIQKGKLSSVDGALEIGDNCIICDANDILACISGKIHPWLTPYDVQPIERMRNINDVDGLWCHGTNTTIGNNACILMDLGLQGSYEKMKDGAFVFGDNALFLTGTSNHHNNSTPYLYAHTFRTGKDTTLCATGDGWYASNYPMRDVQIGDNSLIRMQVHRDGQLVGSDIKAPNDAVVVI